jgi:hypothetical protein
MRNHGMRYAVGLLVAVLGVTTSAAFGQAGEGEKRGSIPLGTSQDGSGPSDGALKGGLLKPAMGASKDPVRDANRCKELSGTLREDCLKDLDASVAVAAPSDAAPAATPSNTLYADPRRRPR